MTKQDEQEHGVTGPDDRRQPDGAEQNVPAVTTGRRKSGAVRRKEPPEPATTMTADSWYLGFASALAEIWRLHRDGQMVRHILSASGITIKHLEIGGVEDLDLNAILAAIAGR